jgi:hypothetical protein
VAVRVLTLASTNSLSITLIMSFLKPQHREPQPLPLRRATLPSLPRLVIASRSPRLRSPASVTIILAAVLSLAIAGCGNSRPTPRPIRSATRTATTLTPLPATGARSVRSGALRATLNAENHSPNVSRPWRYSLKVTNTSGEPLSGTVAVEFLLAGQIVAVDKPPTHPISNGLWQSTLHFPATAIGYPLTVRAIAHTPVGSITLNWPITVHR